MRIAALSLLLLAGCETTIHSKLTERQANQIIVALAEQAIGARKEADRRSSREHYSVKVARGEAARALGVLSERQLPAHPDPGFEEIYGQGSTVPTLTESRALHAAALGGELARTLETVDGVVDARVHVAPALEAGTLDRTSVEPPRSSVLIKLEPHARRLPDAQVQAILLGAVQGLSADRIQIVQVHAARRARRPTSSVQLGPVTLAAGGAGSLRLILGAALALNAALAIALVLWVRRRRRAQP